MSTNSSSYWAGEISKVTSEINEINEKITKINEAVTKVQTARSNVKNANSGHDYVSIKNNLGANWNVNGTNLDSTARNNIISNLDKLDGYINAGSEIMSAAGNVLGAATKKLEELNTELSDKQNYLTECQENYQAALEREAAEAAAELAAAEEESNKAGTTGFTQETK